MSGTMTTTTQAPSVNFTVAKMTTTKAVSDGGESVDDHACAASAAPGASRWYLAMPDPAMVNPVNTPMA